MADQGGAPGQAAAPQGSGWERLGKLLNYAFSKHTPGEEVGGACASARPCRPAPGSASWRKAQLQRQPAPLRERTMH